MRFKLLVILGALLIATPIFFGQQVSDSTNLQLDGEPSMEVRQLDQSDIENYNADSEFNYLIGPRDETSWWDKIKWWFYVTFIQPLFQGGAGKITQVLYYFLAFAGVAALFYFIFQGRKASQLSKKEVTWGEVYANPAKVDEAQFLSWISAAEDRGDFQEALKYLYLWTIKQLDDKNIVRYRSEYTNRQVLQKLSDPQLKHVFQSVSTHFEYVWYGHFELEKKAFDELKQLAFQSQLK